MASIHATVRRQSGLTLIELMVALVLSLVLLAGVVQLFIANKTTYRTQEGLARLQESGRFAMHEISRKIRSAGFFGCANIDMITPSVIANDPPVASIVDGTGVDGIDDSDTVGITTFNSAGTMDAVAGTDVLTVRGAGDSGVGMIGNLTAVNANIQVEEGYKKFFADDLLLITDCEGADLFRATTASLGATTTTITHASSTNTSNFLSKPYTADAMIMRAFAFSYFIADTGRNNAAGGDILALYRRDNSNTAAVQDVELIEGVSNLQVLYGLDMDQDSNRQADSFVRAVNVPDWSRVVSVRVNLLVDSIEDTLDNEAGYNFNGTTVAATAGDFRMRQEFVVMTTLRNKVL